MADNTDNDQIKLILDLLKEGEENVKFDTHNDAVLVLGNTGSGKSTFTYFVTENDDTLVSKEVGPGEYIVIDTDDKISDNSTITSKTIFPDLVIDKKTNTAFYDCPGFSDTRSAAYDISANYFIKKVINSTNAVKLIFTVSYPSVRYGVDRQDFMLLLKHVTTMIKDIEKFKDSIALAVTKVDNTFVKEGKDFILVPDDKVIEGIASFIEGVKQELETKIGLADSPLQEKEFYKNAVKFIDALLTQHGQEYTKIGIFRRPDESGPLSKITLLQDGKKSLQKIIFDSIQFIAHDEGDFSYTISSESKIYVHSLVEEMNKSITLDIANVGQEIAEYYQAQEKQFHDIEMLYSRFKLGYDVLYETKEAPSKFVKPGTFIKQIIKNLNKLNINISGKNLLNILNYEQYLEFLQTVSDQETSRPAEWAQGLTNIVGYLDNSQKWYSFLVTTYIMLSKYDIQQDISKYDITRLKKQIIINNGKEVKVTEIDLKEFVDQINQQEYDIAYNNIKDITLDQFKLEALGKVLDLTLGNGVKPLCQSNKLVMRGQYVKLSDVTNQTCPEQIKSIAILALNKVFIDTNLNKTGDKLHLSIIAPTWDIIGNEEIILDGKPGEVHAQNKPTGLGKDGKPGLPGGSAGSFIGIEQLSNGQRLSISANGGKGGPGQQGNDGASGHNGEPPNLIAEDIETGKHGINSDSFYSVSRQLTQWERDGQVAEKNKIRCWGSAYAPNAEWCTYGYKWNIYSKNCTDGLNGGNGGMGGKGGNTGDIIVVKPNEDLKISIVNSPGETGTNGTGGSGGMEGKINGQLLVVDGTVKTSRVGSYTEVIYIRYKVTSRKEFPCAPGRAGITGYNDAGIQDPEEAAKFLNPSHTANNYKNYLRENLSGSIRESSLREFLVQLENNQAVKDLYDTLGFVNELQGLENQYYKLHTELSLIPFYKSLQQRISQYADKPKDVERSMGYKKALSYTYTATLSKICSFNNDLENNMVINLNGYLDLVINNISKLKDLSNVVAINAYQKNYQEAINAKTKEAEQFIDTKITPAISNVFDQIENQMLLLVDEVIALQNATKEEKRQLIKKEQELEQSMVIRKLLGAVKITSQFLNFLGPVGAATSAAIGGGIMVAESLAFDDVSVQGKDGMIALPTAVKNSLTKITDQLKNKQQLFKLQLQDAEQELKKFSDEQPSSNITDVNRKILDTRTKLENEIAKGVVLDPATTEGINAMRKEVVDLLQTKKDALKEQKLLKDAIIDKLLTLLSHVQNIISIGDMSIAFYRSIRNDQAKIDSFGDAIRNEDAKLIQLEQYEADIYKIIIPVCRDIENSVTKMEKELQNKSHVALDISKWQIQSSIKEMKYQMQKMTQGFSVQEDLTRCIEKLAEGMSILINVYDRIDDYHDKAELAAYISDVSSSNAKKFIVENVELNTAITNLALVIKSNIILGQYERAMKAFKQYIFPFAQVYLEEFNSTLSLKLDDDIDTIVSNAVTQIEVIKSKMSESAVVINKYDKYVHNNITFNSGQGMPFFIWQHDNNKATISKLFEGKEITIKADITKGIGKNSIKFNVIGIRFKLANETIQNELDEQLQHFDASMTHVGISYYRCGNRFYTIMSDEQVISFSLNTGEPLRTNLVYDKLKNNDYILSPYAMWSIKLTNFSGSFDTLAKYKNQGMDLVLEGRGQYIDQGIDVCDDNLKNYYKVDDTISEINNIDVYNQEDPVTSYHRRQRRGIVTEHDLFNEDIEKESFVTSGSCSNFKSSYMNNIFNLISSGLVALKYLNLVNRITRWLVKDEDVTDNSSIHMKLINVQPLSVESPGISSRFIDEDPSISEGTDYSLLNTQGNLLLLDLLIRKKNGVKYNDNSAAINHTIDNEYAHNLAYNAYAPR